MYFFEKNKFKLIISAVAFLLVVLIAVSSATGGKIPVVSDVVSFIVSPFQKAAYHIKDGTNNFFSMFRSNANYARENKELKEKVADLENQLRQTETYIKENDRFRQMLELKQKNADNEYVVADILSKDMTNWSNSFTIDKGLVDGITKDCTVITVEGLVGHISEVGRNWAKVVTIIDSSSSVGSTITRLNVNTVINGDITLTAEGKCMMNYITKDTNLEIGDYAVTSGMGGIYPEGLYIGKVTELNDDPSGLSRTAVIDPGVDFYHLSEVMVIKK